MNFIKIFILILFSFSAYSQIDTIPDSYNELKSWQNYFELLKEYDYVIDPIFRVSTIDTEVKSWRWDYYDMNTWSPKFSEKSKGGVVLVIHDTACELDNDLLPSNIVNGKNFTNEDGCLDMHMHSTHVTGIVAAGDKIGTSYDLVKKGDITIIVSKVMNSQGAGYSKDIAESINFYGDEALKYGDKVVHNLSLGSMNPDSVITKAVKEVVKKGQIVIAASGNNGRNDVSSPADDGFCWAIGAIDKYDNLAWFSNYGKELFMVGTGLDIVSTLPNNKVGSASGTSMATPDVCSHICNYWSMNPDATSTQIQNSIVDITKDLGETGRDEKYGFGVALMESIYNTDPLDYEDIQDPIGDDNDNDNPITHPNNKRTFKLDLNGLTALHLIQGQQVESMNLDFTVEITTNSVYPDCYTKLLDDLEYYFGHTLLVLPENWDRVDAVNWWGHFINISFTKQFNYDLSVVNMLGDSEIYDDKFGFEGLTNRVKFIFSSPVNIVDMDLHSFFGNYWRSELDVIVIEKKPNWLSWPKSKLRTPFKFRVSKSEFYSKGIDLIIQEKLGDVRYEASFDGKFYQN